MANTLDTATSTLKPRLGINHVTHGTTKFLATSTANVSLSIWKDSNFTKMFSATNMPSRPVPLATKGLFMLRDGFTIFASFNLPPLLAPHIPMEMFPSFMQGVRSQSVAQFVAPAAIQVLSTPLHLLGLDLYNNPAQNGNGWKERWIAVKKNWVSSCCARVCRIVPAFGVGGVVNTDVRKNLMARLA
jgi:hypothetical protein